jgi:hypothetical protein
VLRLSPKASADIGLMDKRMELLVISLFVGEVVGLDTGWTIGPPGGCAGVSASAGASQVSLVRRSTEKRRTLVLESVVL